MIGKGFLGVIKNITDKPITIMYGCTQRTIAPNEIVDVNKEFDCQIEQRFADKYAGSLVKYVETTVTFSIEDKTLTANITPEIKIEKVTIKKPKHKKR